MNQHFTLITGGTSGIGFSVAKRLAQLGHDLALVYLKDDIKAANAVAELKLINSLVKIETFKQDLSQVTNIAHYFSEIKKCFGEKPIGFFVSCHGQINSNLFLMKKGEDILKVFNEHLISNVLLTHEVLKIMCLNKFGKIIFLTSLASKKINRGQADYATSKAALETFAKSMTAEHYHRHVTFNCVSAGLVNTRVNAKVKEVYEGKDKTGAKIVDVESVANLIMLLLSDANGDISGSVFSIDGGQACLGNNLAYHRLSHHIQD